MGMLQLFFHAPNELPLTHTLESCAKTRVSLQHCLEFILEVLETFRSSSGPPETFLSYSTPDNHLQEPRTHSNFLQLLGSSRDSSCYAYAGPVGQDAMSDVLQHCTIYRYRHTETDIAEYNLTACHRTTEGLAS